MPVVPCRKDGKPGYSPGKNSTSCHVYTPGDENSRKEMKKKAYIQMYAIEKSKERHGKASIEDIEIYKEIFEDESATPEERGRALEDYLDCLPRGKALLAEAALRQKL